MTGHEATAAESGHPIRDYPAGNRREGKVPPSPGLPGTWALAKPAPGSPTALAASRGGFPGSGGAKTAADVGDAAVHAPLDVISREDRMRPVTAAPGRSGKLNVLASNAGIAGRVRARTGLRPPLVRGSHAGTAAFVPSPSLTASNG